MARSGFIKATHPPKRAQDRTKYTDKTFPFGLAQSTLAIMTISSAKVRESITSMCGGYGESFMTQLVPTKRMPEIETISLHPIT